MTQLSELRTQLAMLRRRRQLVRWGTAYAALALAVLWTLAAALLLDVAFEMSRPQRLVMLVVSALIVYWAARRFTLPWLAQRETELDVALLVERQQKIDSDLVAALQFESPGSEHWGSPQLKQAVVDYVAEFGRGWNVFEGFSQRGLTRRAALVGVTAAACGLGALLAPEYVSTFLNRFLLGSAHYPTATRIERLFVNGREVDWNAGSGAPLKAPYGQPLRLEVLAAGVLPAQGRADLRTLGAGLETHLDLLPASERPSAFGGELAKLIDSVRFQLFLGDAWTDPLDLVIVPLPVVEMKLTPTPPAYARGAQADVTEGSRQLSVIEGSRVELQIACANKRLKEAWITIEGRRYPLTKTAEAKWPADAAAAGTSQPASSGEIWTLAVDKGPLARVEKPTTLELQVTDEDDLQLEHPLLAGIRIKVDQRPRISAEVVTKFVLPAASPRIEFRASDDYGIGQLLVHLQATRADGTVQELPVQSIPDPRQPNSDSREPILADRLPLKEAYRLDLSPLKLVKGDQLQVVLEAIDYRGTAAGQSARSEPLNLQVTDESGVLAAISESDEKSARQLDAIITRQLGIGGSK